MVTDLTAQLNSEKQKLANSEKELSSIGLVKSGLEEQLALFEKQVKTEESRNGSLQVSVFTHPKVVSVFNEFSFLICTYLKHFSDISGPNRLNERESWFQSTPN